MKHNYTTRSIRHWGRGLFGFLLLGLLLPVGLRAQTTLSPGDLVFVGYNGSDDQGFTGNGQAITPGSNVNDKFAFVLLKDVAANTKIFFTDYGWLTGGGFQPAWVAGPANGGSGTGSRDDGILSWTASTSVAAGTQVVIRCKYSIGASTGTVAVVEAVSGQTYPLNLADADNDQLFAYQASSGRSAPTLLAGVMYGDVWSTSLNATEYTSAKSILPPALALTPSAALNLPSTSTIYNTYALGIYNCSVITGFPKQLRNAVTTQTKWKDYVSTISYPGYGIVEGFLYNTDPDYLTAVPAGWDVPIGCTFTVLQVLITAQPVSKTVCSYQSATFSIAAQNAQTYKWQVSPDGSTNWTDLANGAVYSGVTSTTLTVLDPTGLNGKFYRGVAMEPTEPSFVPSNAAQLTVNNPPQALALNPGGNITCIVPAVTLTASSGTSGLTYAYRGPAGVISSTPAANTISAGQGGLYSVTATTTQSCTASASFIVIEDKTPPASVGLTASGPLTCTATSVTLTAAASATSSVNYTFTGPQGSIAAVGNKAVVSAAGTYTVTATASTNGCTATATTDVTSTTTAPTATLANNGTITCASPSVTLTAGTNTGTRFVFSTGAAQIGGSSGNTAVVTGSGTYTVVVTADNGCTATASTTVGSDIAPPTSVSLTSGTLTCAQTSLTLTASSTGGVSYAFSGGTPLGSNQLVVTTGGPYSVTVTGANGCTASTSVSVGQDITQPPATLASSGTLTCTNTSVTLTANTGAGLSYRFSTGATQLGSSNQATVSTSGTYSVTVTGANGCIASTSVSVSQDITQPPATLASSGTLTCTNTSVTLTANTGAGLSYRFSAGATQLGSSNQATVNIAGTYSVTVIGTNGCSSTTSVGVSQDQSAPPATLASSGTLTCTNTSVTLTANTGAGLSYTFSAGATQLGSSNQATVSTSGTYSVTVTGTNGCFSTTSVGVSQDQSVPPATLANSGIVTCTNTSVTLTANTGAGLSYRFSAGATQIGSSNQATVSTSGTYSVTVTGANGCTASTSVGVSQNTTTPSVSISPSSGTLTCAITSLTLTANSVANPLGRLAAGLAVSNLRWNTGAITPSISVTTAGTYSVTYTAPNGCTASQSVSISQDQSAPLATLASSGTLTCTNTSVTLTANTGAGLSYRFSAGATQIGSSNQATVSTSGTYSVTVTGANGCIASTSVSVGQNSTPPPATLASSGTLTCTNTSVTLTAGGGASYAFSGPGLSQSGPANTAVVSTSGLYSVIVTGANGCTASTSVSVGQDITPLPATLASSGTLTCTNTSVTLTANSGAGLSYRFSAGATQIGSSNQATVSTSGTYSVTVTGANGCIASTSVSVSQDITQPPATLASSGTLTCTNTSVTLTANTGAGLSYRFSAGATQLGSSNQATVNIAGTYSVTVIGTNGCFSTTSVGVSQDITLPPATLASSGTLTCTNTSVTLTANTGAGLSYTFSGPGLSQSGPANTAVVSTSGLYSVTVTTANGCFSTTSVSVGQNSTPPPATLASSGTLTCTNTSVTLTANSGAGLSYTFSAGATQLGSSNQATVNIAGTYSVTVTGANGCTNTTSVLVQENIVPPFLSISPSSGTLTCAINSLTLTANTVAPAPAGRRANATATGLIWNTGATTSTISVSAAGTYSVTLTGTNGCSSTASVSISQDQSLPTASLVSSGTLTCVQTSVTLTASGGSSYTFSGPGLSQSGPANTAVVSTSGLYSVSVTASNGCVSTTSVTVRQDASLPAVSISPSSATLTCLSPTASLSATGTGSFRWNTGAISPLISVSTAATYSVTLTAANGCVASASAVVGQDASVPTASLLSSGTLTCTQTSVTLVAGGGASYTFSGPGLSQSGPANTAVVSTSGLYSVTVTGANGCFSTTSIVVSQNLNPPPASLASSGTLTCTNTSVTLTANTGVGLSYRFSAGATQLGSSNQATVNIAGTYSVTITGANGCSSTTSVGVSQDQSVPPATLASSGTLTCTNTSVTLTANTGAGLSYTFSGPGLSQSGPANTAVVSTSGLYSVIVTAANGCSSTATVTVSQDANVPSVSISPSSATLTCAQPSVNLTASGSGNFRWSTGATTASISVSMAATYSVTLTATNGCAATASITVEQAPNQTIAITGQPASASSVTVGSNVATTVMASGNVLNYQWLKAGQPLAGQTSATLSLPNVQLTDGGSYVAVLMGACNSLTSSAFSLSVSSPTLPTAPFAITSVTTISCTPILPGRFSLSFDPQYAGLTGQPISFSVVNELRSTTQPGPYTLQVYTDNPVITLEATQLASPGPVRFVYNWLAACNSTQPPPNTAPRVVMTIPDQSATVGQPFSFVIPEGTFTDTETPGSLVLSARGLPAGLSFTGATLSGTPSASGISTVLVTATDPGSLSVATSFRLTVLPNTGPTPPDPTQPFAITGVTTISCTQVVNRYNISFVPRYAGLNGQTIAFEAVNELRPTTVPGPYALTLYADNPVITLQAIQTGSPAAARFSYNWLAACNSIPPPANTAPITTGIANQTTTVGQGFTLNVASSFQDAETPNGLSYAASGLPTGLSLSGPVISGTPSMSGISTVSITATDPGSLSVATQFTLTVLPASVINPPQPGQPFAITGVTTLSCSPLSANRFNVSFTPRYSGQTGQPISFSVANEMSPTTQPGPYTLALYTDNPSVVLKASQSGSPGEASFGYNWLAACQGSQPPANTPPTTTGIANQTATVGQGFTLNVASSFQDAETPNGLSYAASGLPTGLSLSGATISGTPSASGVSTVLITVTDPGSLSVGTSFTITVRPNTGVTPPNPPQPTAPFAITGVTTLSCTPVATNQFSVRFSPQYTGLTGQPISFSVVNELSPTTQPGPYTLLLYRDNPSVTLKAQQGGTVGEASFGYSWLAACANSPASPGGRLATEPEAPLQVLVLGNPTESKTVQVIIRGADHHPLVLRVTNERGQAVSRQALSTYEPGAVLLVEMNETAGVYLLEVSTNTQHKIIRITKQ